MLYMYYLVVEYMNACTDHSGVFGASFVHAFCPSPLQSMSTLSHNKHCVHSFLIISISICVLFTSSADIKDFKGM